MANVARDENRIPTIAAVSNADSTVVVPLYADPTTHRLLVSTSGSTTPGGSDTQVQFNDGGTMAGDAGLTYNKTTDTLTVAGDAKVDRVGMEDTDSSHYLYVEPGSNLTADRVLTVTTGDSDRTLTVSGNATVSQDYSTTGNPQFATIELGAASDTTISRSSAGVIAVEGVTVPLNSTSSAHTASTIELGHASDTTLSRSSAGVLAVEGVTVSLNSTSATHTAGTIELGNASDTTISRSSAGVIAVEGVTVPLNSTSATHTAGTIELGAATDTTLSRASAGVLAVEGVNVVTVSATQTLTNKRITDRVQSVTDAATITPNADTDDCVDITAIAQAFTIANPTGTPTNFQKLIIRIKDNGTARAISFGTNYVAGGVALPTTTVISKILTLGFIYNTANSLNKWQLVASASEA